MTMHVPALHAPSIPDDVENDVAGAAAERRRDYVETLLTLAATVVVITAVSIAAVALELG